METIQLTQNIAQDITVISNQFIDRYMARADGEFVKIYLLILRHSREGLPVATERIADILQLTQKDVLRAVHYWEKEGLLSFTQPGQESSSGQEVPSDTPAMAPEKHTHSASELSEYIKGSGLDQLIFMAETYIGHPLSVQELNSICYISDELRFSPELLEYLVEYCSERGKKQIRYMEKVAINWYQQGIDTVAKAAEQTAAYTRNVFSVMKAFGISGRNPGKSEVEYIKHWNSMGFESDIIIEACNRTLITTHQASFPYANRILEDWKKAGVHNLSDVSTIDREYQARIHAKNQEAEEGQRRSPSNSFHNFDQRTYDYDELAARLSSKKRR